MTFNFPLTIFELNLYPLAATCCCNETNEKGSEYFDKALKSVCVFVSLCFGNKFFCITNQRNQRSKQECCSAPGILFLFQDSEVDLYVGVARCLSEMSDTEIDRIVQVSEVSVGSEVSVVSGSDSNCSVSKTERLCASQAQVEKACFVLAFLTSQGRLPLLSLNDVITGVLCGWSSCRLAWILLQAFYQCRLTAGTSTGQSAALLVTAALLSKSAC